MRGTLISLHLAKRPLRGGLPERHGRDGVSLPQRGDLVCAAFVGCGHRLFCSSPEPFLARTEAIQHFVRKGWLVDSGQRRWSQRTGRYEIVWESTVFGKTLQ